MQADFLYALNAVLPVFVVAVLAYILRNAGLITDAFTQGADKLVFKLLLPSLLFTQIAGMDIGHIQQDDYRLVLFCLFAVLALFLTLCVFVPLFTRDNGKRGAFIQGVYRSNMAILGVPFAINLFGDEGGRIAAMVLAIVVPVYNILAVTVLSIFDPSSSKKSLFGKIFKVLFGIIKNPLIISIALGGIVCAFDITLPAFADKTINYFANASTPLALIAIGASFRFSDLKGRAGFAVCGAFLKTIAIPFVMLYIANTFFGFTGARLGIVLVVFGTPTAVSSYIMAKNMNSDHKLANQIVLLTTLMSAFTIFAGSFILRRLGLI